MEVEDNKGIDYTDGQYGRPSDICQRQYGRPSDPAYPSHGMDSIQPQYQLNLWWLLCTCEGVCNRRTERRRRRKHSPTQRMQQRALCRGVGVRSRKRKRTDRRWRKKKILTSY